MSVYTILKNKDVRRILSSYDIGTLQSFRGISEGITNTNYFINTSSGKYVLTIFEDIKKSIRIYALVKVNNIHSIKLFTSAGYTLCDIDDNGFAKYFIDF